MLKYWAQLVLVLVFNIVLIFIIPIYSNFREHGRYYCKPLQYSKYSDYKCGNLDKNKSMIIVYLLICIYFTLLGLQIKYNIPKVMRSYFMLEEFSPLNKYLFKIYYFVPFLFELRNSIDWAFTMTALDIF